ncbi:hypothetical protein AVEN_202593-1 [Araneus ventricosus]|uniref:Uncharacterized protein n=1 Tax=Araneus ventricosus TaxID=182803 RepID=A0A4Y2QMI5_ARAVE|nr:hypothetical protein AVEN_202593-1 [Araneus ventricosus]
MIVFSVPSIPVFISDLIAVTAVLQCCYLLSLYFFCSSATCTSSVVCDSQCLTVFFCVFQSFRVLGACLVVVDSQSHTAFLCFRVVYRLYLLGGHFLSTLIAFFCAFHSCTFQCI